MPRVGFYLDSIDIKLSHINKPTHKVKYDNSMNTCYSLSSNDESSNGNSNLFTNVRTTEIEPRGIFICETQI